ncbi:MAG: hypothetical protein KKB95_19805 [Gammaproteobacteria bacterium]|nr:hypothetical protein [Gammaproteobacteria bacterium]MBU1506523.1 hypothetical protein [Gammaproteobacteria bacterium]MBU2119041.1 hypothetical protein [Gammaproteobacteria bacterium]MBU2171816.1 hypothetical protein [Gammaproteobacteria bacterium]MBU2201233.1 hypothetical protein [Gammaproteobacteria bacterium]
MDKKTTDRAINRWVLKFLLGPASLISLLAFGVGHLYLDLALAVQPLAQRLGLDHVVAERTIGSQFASAAYLYWFTFWLTLPLNLFWLLRVGYAERVSEALCAIERSNLRSGIRDPAKFTLLRGYLVWVAAAVMFIALFATQLLIAHEPSYCKGCETTSVPGFVIINWGMTHLLLIAIYIGLSKVVSWGSVRSAFGD